MTLTDSASLGEEGEEEGAHAEPRGGGGGAARGAVFAIRKPFTQWWVHGVRHAASGGVRC